MIGVITVIIYILQLLIMARKYNLIDMPFADYEDREKHDAARISKILWKSLLLLMGSMLVGYTLMSVLSVETFSNFNAIFKKIYISNISILFGTLIIKEIFHNYIIYNEKYIYFFKKHSPTRESLLKLALLNMAAIIIISLMIVYLGHEKLLIYSIIIISILSLTCCFYRIVSETIDLLYVHRVHDISIMTVDGTIYDKIKYYSESNKVICIDTKENMRYYLNKEQVIYVNKLVDEKAFIDEILKK